MAATVLEQAVFARAVTGVEEPVWHYGKRVGTRRRYSDSLLKLLLQRGDLAQARECDGADVDHRAGRGWTPVAEMTQEEARAEVTRRIERIAAYCEAALARSEPDPFGDA